MSTPDATSQETVKTRTVEIAVALLFMAAASLVIADSWRIGASWSAFGPESGFFPFYVGVAMLISSTLTLLVNLMKPAAQSGNFVERGQLGLVLKVFVPTALFAALIGFLGIYVAAAIYLTFFMWWIGNYPIYKAVPGGLGTSLILFWLFEVAFAVPLPKGPLEAALGY